MKENGLTVKEVYDYLGKLIEEGLGDNQLECSVDMSVDGDETTYPHRVFGRGLLYIYVFYMFHLRK